MVLSPSRRRGMPSMPVMAGVIAVVFLCLIGVAIAAHTTAGTNPHADMTTSPAARALIAYGDAIYPATEEAGKSIVAGIRPDIADFSAGKLAVSLWNTDMLTRQQELAHARQGFDSARAPKSVKDAPALFDRAFDQYQQAVRLLLEAGTVEGQARTDLITRAAALGDQGDSTFDRGTARIQAARRALGLGPDTRFSDVPAR
jgi:hypothetical protein